MQQRAAQTLDVCEAVLSATEANWSEEEGTWKLTGGKDLDGDVLDVVVVIAGNEVSVVTVF
jgi:hypothetical protein